MADVEVRVVESFVRKLGANLRQNPEASGSVWSPATFPNKDYPRAYISHSESGHIWLGCRQRYGDDVGEILVQDLEGNVLLQIGLQATEGDTNVITELIDQIEKVVEPHTESLLRPFVPGVE
jgi:hypothetical protein